MSRKKKPTIPDSAFEPRPEYTVDQLEDLAFRGAPIPDGLTLTDTELFTSSRALYAYARQVQMPPDQGRREKQKLLAAYEHRRFLDGLLERSVQLWADVEILSAEYHKHSRADLAGLVDIADRLLARIYRTGGKRVELSGGDPLAVEGGGGGREDQSETGSAGSADAGAVHAGAAVAR